MQAETKPSKETLKQWHEDPANWRYGFMYYNKNDKRLFPPKRIPALGWTINFANPISILLFIFIVLFILALTFSLLKS